MHRYRWLTAILAVLSALVLASCRTGPEVLIETIPAAVVEQVEGSEFNRLVLTEKAGERLGIEVASIREVQIDGKQRIAIPYAAVLYGTNGDTWTYIAAANPLTFTRQLIEVDYIENDLAILSANLPTDIEVVTVGVSELYGLDTGVGR
jgi:hypothetical protein